MEKSIQTISINTEVLKRARAAGFNISRAAEEGIRNRLGMTGSLEEREQKLKHTLSKTRKVASKTKKELEEIKKVAAEREGFLESEDFREIAARVIEDPRRAAPNCVRLKKLHHVSFSPEELLEKAKEMYSAGKLKVRQYELRPIEERAAGVWAGPPGKLGPVE